MKIALAQINPIIGSLEYNCRKIIEFTNLAKQKGAKLVVFPEMAICGYPPEDLLLLPSFIRAIDNSLKIIIRATRDIAIVVGCIRENFYDGEKKLFNSAAIIQNGELIGFQDKILLPDYDIFFERRYFEPGKNNSIWFIENMKVAITICEDIWQHAQAVEYSNYPRDPIIELRHYKPDILINLSASPFYVERKKKRLNICCSIAQTLNCPVLLCNQVGGNDSLIFDGYSFCLNADGKVINCAKGFKEDIIYYDDEEKSNSTQLTHAEPIEDLFCALVLGVRDYFYKLGWKKACLGLSGGIDSSVVAVIAKEALGKENVLALILPSRYSSQQSSIDAQALIKKLGINFESLSIEKPLLACIDTLAPFFEGRASDVTEENLQARIRGLLLMAFSNKFDYLLLNTSNKSEMAMGYTTLYGDMCGGLGVISDVIKEQVYNLAHFINKFEEVIPTSVITKPPSAELRFNQKDIDSLPEYSVIDTIVQAYVEEHLSPEEIAKKYKFSLKLVKELVRKIHLNEYKRRQAPPGLRVTKKSFTIGRRFPIVQHWNTEVK